MTERGEIRVRPVGELTAAAVSSFVFELDEAVLASCCVIVDLTAVSRVSPPAIEALAEASRYLRDRDCELRIEHATPTVRELLEALGFKNLVPSADDRS